MVYYFDNAATTLKKPASVATAVFEAIQSETLGNPSRGAHEPSLNAFRSLYQTRLKVAELFHVSNELTIGFTMNATMALNIAIKGLIPDNSHVISTVLEHNSVLRPLYQLEAKGVTTSFVSYDREANQLNYDDFEKLLTPETKAVVCTHGSNVLGDILDLAFISEFCQKHELMLLVDASQTAGVCDINFDELNLTVLCFTGHKSLYGPQGTGGLIVKEGCSLTPLLVGGSGTQSFSKTQPSELPDLLEAGTANVHSLLGLDAGLDYVIKNKLENFKHTQHELVRTFYESLYHLPELIFYGTTNNDKKTGIVSLNIKGISAATVANDLSEYYDIAVRPGAHCAPLVHQTFGTEEQGMVRFSFSSFNTVEEVKYAVNARKELVEKYK